MAAVNYRTADVDGLQIFYREAGAAAAPHLLLLHGFKLPALRVVHDV